MAKTKRRRNRPRRTNAGYGHRKHHRRHRMNPARRHHHVMHRRHRRNPGGAGMGRISDIAINAVFVIAGALGSKLLTQMVLGSNNTGLIGYAGNAVAGGLLWFLVEKVMKNKNAANGIIAGTAVQIILRLINDYTPFGQYVSNLGMGDYQAQAFVTPQVLVDPYTNAQIQIPPGWAPVIQAPAKAGVGDLYGGRGGLY